MLVKDLGWRFDSTGKKRTRANPGVLTGALGDE
jgi:hypothetical protein